MGMLVGMDPDLKCEVRCSQGDLGKNIFTQRVVGIWTALHEEMVEGQIFTSFRRHLDKHLNHQDLVGYRPGFGKRN